MSGDVHAGFCESRGVKLPPATLLVLLVAGNRTHAEDLLAEAAAVLAPMGLVLSEAKTGVVHIDEGFTFLGFRIRRDRKEGTKGLLGHAMADVVGPPAEDSVELS